MSVTIDRDSPPGSWRAALNPDAASCRVCGQNECAHPDPIYAGVIPPFPSDPAFHAEPPSRKIGGNPADRPSCPEAAQLELEGIVRPWRVNDMLRAPFGMAS